MKGLSGCSPAKLKVTSRVTGLDWPFMVSLPSIWPVRVPVLRTAVLTKVISGCWSVLKKSLLRRWSSRAGTSVSMLLAWIVTSTLLFSGFSWSNMTTPSTSSKRPYWLDRPRWL